MVEQQDENADVERAVILNNEFFKENWMNL